MYAQRLNLLITHNFMQTHCTRLGVDSGLTVTQESYASEWSYLAARMRCAARLGGPEVQFGSYIVPRGPTGTVSHGSVALLKKALALVGAGAKGFDWFEFGPEPLFPGNCWTAIGMHEKNHSMFHWIGEASRMIADAEDLLYPGVMPVSEVAILFPRSSWLWDNATVMTGSCTTDKKDDPECSKLGPQCVATIDLYCSTEAGGPAGMCSDCLAAWTAKLDEAKCPKNGTGAFDATLLSYCEGLGPAGPFNNEDQGSGTMDYHAQVYALFRSLQQVSNYQVDLIDEDELTTKGLSPFKALIVTEPDIPAEGQTAVGHWVQAGGNLMTVSGAATGDRYNQPSAVVSSVTGIMEAPPRPRKMIQWTSKLAAVATGTGKHGPFTAYGVRGNLVSPTLLAEHVKPLAQFSDGSPAIVRNSAVGKGTATHFAFLPGIRFRNQNPYRSDPHFNSVVNYTDGSLPYVLEFLNASGVVPRVTVSAAQVETPLLTSADGSVLTLLNWGAPVGDLLVTVQLGHDVAKVTAIGTSARLKFKVARHGGDRFAVSFSMPLEHCDFVTLHAKK
jgi:hypothetical protein